MGKTRKMDYAEIWRRTQAGQPQTRIAGEMGYNAHSVCRAVGNMRRRGGPTVPEVHRHVESSDCPQSRIARCDPDKPSECDDCPSRWLCQLRVIAFAGPTACEYKGRVEWQPEIA
jgi:hypothetical protein